MAATLASAAEDQPSAQLGEVVVTAQRREENSQHVPIVVNSIDATQAVERGVESTMDLGNIVPGLILSRTTSTGLVFLRGVGSATGAAGAEGPIAFYLDDVYLSSLNANMFGLNSIQRVQVLSGPQGTLFGRNALGGVVQVVTKDPKQTPSLDAHVGYGNYQTFHADLYGTTGITDTLAADLSVLYDDQAEGYGHNLSTGRPVYKSNETSVRTKWMWTPDEDTNITFSLLHDRRADDTGVSSRLLAGSLGKDGVTTGPANFYDVNENTQGTVVNKEWVASLKASEDLKWATIKNVVAYQEVRNDEAYDTDFTPAFISLQNPVQIRSKTITEELQLLSPSSTTLNWIAGLFYLNNRSGYDPIQIWNVPPAPALGGEYYGINSNLNTNSFAGYGQATVAIRSDTQLTIGARYTHDAKHVYGSSVGATGLVFGAGDQEASWNKITYRAALDHNFTDDVLGYVSYNRGFKAGTFNTTAVTSPAVAPEVIDDFEGGIKSEFFNHRLRLNVAGFCYCDYSDMQLRTITASNTILLLNAAKSRDYGADVSFEALITGNFSVTGAVEYLDAKFLSFPGAPATARNPAGGNLTVPTDFSGRPVFLAPKSTASLGALYALTTAYGIFDWSANYQFNDGFSWAPQVDDRSHQGSFGLLDLGVLWTPPSKAWDVRLWGKNVTGKKYNVNANTSAFGDYGSPGPPATYGITFGIHL